MNDIQAREDIELLVNTFYDRVKQDETIGFIFHQVIGEDWSHHLPIMYAFWETVIFQKAGYTGNPVKKHIDIDQQIPLKEEHYARWVALWTETVDDLFAGANADEIKNRAALMMNLISIKVQMARQGKTIM